MIKGAMTQRTASLCRTALHSCRDAVIYIYKKKKKKGVLLGEIQGEEGGHFLASPRITQTVNRLQSHDHSLAQSVAYIRVSLAHNPPVVCRSC